MRRRDPRVSLSDVLAAGTRISQWLAGVSLERYSEDEVLSSAVERQFEIVGEALNRTLDADPALRARIPDASGVIGFRNMLAHGYDEVSDRVVFTIAQNELPDLIRAIETILGEIG
jgi:uncharacterized protein with HEPN domain